MIALVGVLALSACDNSPTGPTFRDVQGHYRATELLYIVSGNPVDVLAAGGLLEVSLELKSTVNTAGDGGNVATGRSIIPAGVLGDETPLEYELRGRWLLSLSRLGFVLEGSPPGIEDIVYTVASSADLLFGRRVYPNGEAFSIRLERIE